MEQDLIGQPEWDNNDYTRDFVWLGQPRETPMSDKPANEIKTPEELSKERPGSNLPSDQWQKEGQHIHNVPTSDVPGSAGIPGSAPGGEGPQKIPSATAPKTDDKEKDKEKD